MRRLGAVFCYFFQHYPSLYHIGQRGDTICVTCRQPMRFDPHADRYVIVRK